MGLWLSILYFKRSQESRKLWSLYFYGERSWDHENNTRNTTHSTATSTNPLSNVSENDSRWQSDVTESDFFEDDDFSVADVQEESKASKLGIELVPEIGDGGNI